MKKLATILFAIFLATGCQNSENQNADEVKKVSYLDSVSSKFKELWLTDEGEFRGFALGDSISKIEKAEKAILDNQYDGMLLYTHEWTKDDYASFQYDYDYDTKKLIRISVFYSQFKKNELLPEMIKFLTLKYGNPTKVNETDQIWNFKTNNIDNIITLRSQSVNGYNDLDLYIENKVQ